MQQVNPAGLFKYVWPTPLQVLDKLSPHCNLKLTKTHISALGMVKGILFGQQLYILQRNQKNTPL